MGRFGGRHPGARDAGGTPRDPTRFPLDLVNRQDGEVRASVQAGMSSSFSEKGRYGPMADDSLDIRRWLLPRPAAHRPTDTAAHDVPGDR